MFVRLIQSYRIIEVIPSPLSQSMFTTVVLINIVLQLYLVYLECNRVASVLITSDYSIFMVYI